MSPQLLASASANASTVTCALCRHGVAYSCCSSTRLSSPSLSFLGSSSSRMWCVSRAACRVLHSGSTVLLGGLGCPAWSLYACCRVKRAHFSGDRPTCRHPWVGALAQPPALCEAGTLSPLCTSQSLVLTTQASFLFFCRSERELTLCPGCRQRTCGWWCWRKAGKAWGE